MIRFSLLTAMFAITVPVVSLLNSIGRQEGQNEFEHLIQQLANMEMWSIYVWIGYACILLWWIYLLKNHKKAKEIESS